jgi:hypothetical protein
MSVKFAKDEKVIKSFDYATVGYNKRKGQYDTFKSLIVTNKRVIHESVNDKRNNEIILRQEMPVADAKYVKTTMGKTSNPAYLLQALLFAIIAAAAVFVSTLDFAEKFYVAFLVLAAPLAVLALVKLSAYFSSRTKVVSFSIFTDHIVTPVICTAAVEAENKETEGKKNTKKDPSLEIRVNADVAREIADGLGAAILDAINYKEESPAEEAIPAYAEIEDAPIDAPEEEEVVEEETDVQ